MCGAQDFSLGGAMRAPAGALGRGELAGRCGHNAPVRQRAGSVFYIYISPFTDASSTGFRPHGRRGSGRPIHSTAQCVGFGLSRHRANDRYSDGGTTRFAIDCYRRCRRAVSSLGSRKTGLGFFSAVRGSGSDRKTRDRRRVGRGGISK